MRHMLFVLWFVGAVGCGNSDTSPDKPAVKTGADMTKSTNAGTAEPQPTSRAVDGVSEPVAAGSGDTEKTSRWYERFVVNQDNESVVLSGTIKVGETVTIDLAAKKNRNIVLGTNVFQEDISFKDGETITFHPMKGAVARTGGPAETAMAVVRTSRQSMDHSPFR